MKQFWLPIQHYYISRNPRSSSVGDSSGIFGIWAYRWQKRNRSKIHIVRILKIAGHRASRSDLGEKPKKGEHTGELPDKVAGDVRSFDGHCEGLWLKLVGRDGKREQSQSLVSPREYSRRDCCVPAAPRITLRECRRFSLSRLV